MVFIGETLAIVAMEQADVAACVSGAHCRDSDSSSARLLSAGLGNRILNILQYKPMYNYPLFVNLLTTFGEPSACRGGLTTYD